MQRYYSNVYWHFTGSPEDVEWHEVEKPKDLTDRYEPKETEVAYDIVEKILSSKKLIGDCTERIFWTEETYPFCCVCDIPIKDLFHHKEYYGDCAIGFRSTAIHEKFSPVLYINPNHIPLDMQRKIDLNKKYKKDGSADELLKDLFGYSKEVAGTLSNFLKLTGFGEDDGDSFYREREWRHFGDFHFEEGDVSAIIVPEEYIDRVTKYLIDNKFESVSVMSWEFLKRA